MREYDFAIVGAGVVGACIAYGLSRMGHRVILLDESDVALRASLGNFGLVWIQSKGVGVPAYAAWARRSGASWQAFADELEQTAGMAIEFEQRGGLQLALSPDELESRMARAAQLTEEAEPGCSCAYEVLDRKALNGLIAGLSPSVVGASFCALDGAVNPMLLVRALQLATVKTGGTYQAGSSIHRIQPEHAGFELLGACSPVRSQKVVLAAGLGTAALAPHVGLHAPVKPVRGQVLVSERVSRLLPLPTMHLRQTADGTLLMGDSHEEVGMNDGTTLETMSAIAARAVATLPALARVRLVRAWGSLRVMTEDGLPIYAQSRRYPGAFVATGHSGFTLAAAHATVLAEGIAAGSLPDCLQPFGAERFDVQAHCAT